MHHEVLYVAYTGSTGREHPADLCKKIRKHPEDPETPLDYDSAFASGFKWLCPSIATSDFQGEHFSYDRDV
jgi:hypothetical protein